MGFFDTVGNFMTSGEVGQIPTGAIITNMSLVIKWVIGLGAVALLGIIFYKFQIQYNLKVRLKFYRGGKLIKIKDDKARELVDKQGKRKLKLFWLQKTTPLPEQKYRYVFGKKDYYEFAIDDNGELHPLETEFEVLNITKEVEMRDILTEEQIKAKTRELVKQLKKESKGKTKKEKLELIEKYKKLRLEFLSKKKEVREVHASIKPIPQERIAWMLQENRIIEDKIRAKNRLDKYLPYIVPIVAYTMLFLLYYFGMKHLAGIAGEVGSGLREVARAMGGG